MAYAGYRPRHFPPDIWWPLGWIQRLPLVLWHRELWRCGAEDVGMRKRRRWVLWISVYEMRAGSQTDSFYLQKLFSPLLRQRIYGWFCGSSWPGFAAWALINELYKKYPRGFVAHVTKGKVPEQCRGLAKYLAKYVASPPIAISRILSYTGNEVTYWYKDHQTKAKEVG